MQFPGQLKTKWRQADKTGSGLGKKSKQIMTGVMLWPLHWFYKGKKMLCLMLQITADVQSLRTQRNPLIKAAADPGGVSNVKDVADESYV